tara:strand:- start:838 stop:1569 length:732 start_codon:yes stop_codon:yes gene_type:complete
MYLKRLNLERKVMSKVSFSIFLLIILIIMGAAEFNKETGDMKQSVRQAVGLVAHVDTELMEGSIFNYILSLGGSIAGLYILIVLITLLYDGKLRDDIREVRNMNKIKALKNHFIVCGAGRVGGNVVEQFAKKKVPFVVIDFNEERVSDMKRKKYPVIEGNSLEKDYLEMAGIVRAKGVICCLNSDGDNLLQIVTAKEMNPKLMIVSSANKEEVVDKFLTIGAHKVILPSVIGGKMIAEVAIKG